MSTRSFMREDLLRLDLPPASPRDAEDRDDIHLDEHVRTLKYTQIRRCVFEVPDGRTYTVEYEAPLDTGDFEMGDVEVSNHGWSRTVAAVEVELRPTAVMQWKPVAAEGDSARSADGRTAHEQLAEIYDEAGYHEDDVRDLAAEVLAKHTRELAAFLHEALHPDTGLAEILLGHARDLDAGVDQDEADEPEENSEIDSDSEVLDAIGDIATRLLDATDEGEYQAVGLIRDLVDSRKTVAEARAELTDITFRHI